MANKDVYIKIDQDDTEDIQVKESSRALSAVCNKIKGRDFTNFVMYHQNELKKQNDPIPNTTTNNPLHIITKVG